MFFDSFLKFLGTTFTKRTNKTASYYIAQAIFSLLESQQILQAENATWEGPKHVDARGKTPAYLDFIRTTGEWIEWKVSSDKTGPETIAFVYACPFKRPLELKVNGKVLESSLKFNLMG